MWEAKADRPVELPLWGLALAFGLFEAFVLFFEFRSRQQYSLSMIEVPVVVALFTARPLDLVLARMIGSVFALVFYRKHRGAKLAFNLASFYFDSAVSCVMFHLLVGVPTHLTPAVWLTVYGTSMLTTLLSTLNVVIVISLNDGSFQRGMAKGVLPPALLGTIATSSIGLIAMVVIWADPGSAWLLGVVVAVLLLTNRSYSTLNNRYNNLELLYDFTKGIDRSLPMEGVASNLLRQARDVMRADIAVLRLVGDAEHEDHPPIIEARLAGDVENTEAPAAWERLDSSELQAKDPLWALALADEEPTLATITGRDDLARRYLESLGMKDRIIIPLRAGNALLGTLEVADRTGDFPTFDIEDVKLFATLASHALVSLDNSRLIDRLRDQSARYEFQALHDGLTALPNRENFQQQTRAAIAAAKEAGRKVAVLLMDLDLFKEVNDTLGHHTGDHVLREVAYRLVGVVGSDGTVARLGGDEFAILLPAVPDHYAAVEVAKRVRLALERPFRLDEMRLEVAGSLGIAVYPDDADEAAALLQRADVAMYTSKSNGLGVEVYSAERDHFSPRRLSLVSELRQGIEQRELVVFYQPKADLRTGRVVGAEALLRWNHPVHGLVSPEEFVPVAEHTGLIRPLTAMVLDIALEQLAVWHDEGLRIGMAVNLSVRNLLDGDLIPDIAARLRNTGLAPGYLTLEITESSVMADPARMVGILNRLATLGIKLSIDDFGTGYSSLSYLKRLPVHEVKIDKSFVMNMASDESDSTIVRSIADLGQNLGLRVVAEGVEDATAWSQLVKYGVDVAQGHLLSEPGSAPEITAWMHLREVRLS